MPDATAPVLLAIDLGTSACKVVLYRGDQVVASESAPVATIHPGPGLAEQDPRAWWDTVRDLTSRIPAGYRTEVAAVGITGQSDSLVAVDDAAEPVRPCILWMDGRGETELSLIRDALGDSTIREVTGLRPALSFTAAKIAWLRHHEPAAFAQARWMLQPKDFLVLRLTGRAVTDPSSASRSMLLDRRSGTWWPAMLDLVGVDERVLPVIRSSGSVAGMLTSEAARDLGLRHGTPVTVGAADRAAEALSSGINGTEAMVSMGTATGIVMSIAAGDRVPDDAILHPAHALADRSMALMAVSTSGSLLEWLARLLGVGPDDDRASLLAEAAAAGPGAGGVTLLPFLMGAKSVRWSQAARGVIAGLDLSTGRGELMRAALEGVAFEIDACLRRLGAALGPISGLVLVGGGQQADLAGRVLVDISGLPALRLQDHHAAAAGAMLLAGQAIGTWVDPLAVARARRHGERLLPDPSRHAVYGDLAERYEGLCVAMGLPAVG
jgi:xylulokinase